MKSKQNLLFFILAVKHSKNLNVKKPGGKTSLGQMLSELFWSQNLEILWFL